MASLTHQANGTANAGDASVSAPPAEGAAASEDLWGSILDEARSSRAVPVKNIVLLGEPRTGKSTLLSSLAASSTSGFISSSSATASSSSTRAIANGASPNPGEETPSTAVRVGDLGMGYGYWDVGDDDGEDTLARVGVYQLPSSHPVHLSLLPLALQSSADAPPAGTSGNASLTASALVSPDAGTASMTSIRETLWLIVLDWEVPWTFLEQLATWLDVVRDVVGRSEGDREGKWSKSKALAEEMREALEAYIRAYVEPVAASTTTAAAVSTSGASAADTSIVPITNPGLADASMPLDEGVLTHNWGVPIVVVCTKADTIAKLERDREFKEEQFDYIQQVLRTICLKYGAALFSTAQSRPQSFDVLRSYVLHRLFTPAPARGVAGEAPTAAGLQATSAGGGASLSRFPFAQRASTVERDVLLVPAGWDSWGKIRALREGFDCAAVAAGWEWDCKVEQVRRERALPRNATGARQAEEEAKNLYERVAEAAVMAGTPSTVRLYEDIISDWKAAPPPHQSASSVKQPEEQAFLAAHYTTLQREPDPRSKLARLNSGSLPPGSAQAAPAAAPPPRLEPRASVVGPMSSASLSLPSVERAMSRREGEEEAAAPSSRPARVSRRESRDPQRSSGAPALEKGTSSGASRPTSPAALASPSATSPGAPKQSEVLHSFFQSLLKDKNTPGGAPSIGRSNRPAAGAGASSSERRSHASSPAPAPQSSSQPASEKEP